MTLNIRSLILLCLSFTPLAAQSLTITSPANGTVVNPGQLLNVSVAGSGTFQEVIVIGGTPVGPSQQVLSAPPYQFTIQVPTTVPPRRYPLTAFGATTPGQVVNSDPAIIDVERPDNPISIRVEPTILELTPGESGGLRIIGLFNDGTTLDLTQSTLITYTSNATVVATVGPQGIVTPVAAGSATVTASYGGLSIGVPVTVPQPLTVVPPRKALYASQTEKFILQLAGLSNPSIVWSVSPSGAGSIDGTGFYTAPSSISAQQTVTVTATNAADNSQFATATVLLYPAAAVTIQPVTATLSASQTQLFTTGVTNAPIAGVSFSISPSGTGTIDTSGLYTAPSSITTPQVATLKATSWVDSTKFASATITLNPPPNAYGFHRTVTVAHSKIPNTDQTNFPVLFSTTDALLKTVANGGHVQNANGYDMIFTSDSAGTVKLDHEIEYYNATTGQFVAWLRVPTLSHTADTVIYLFYGNTNITTSQENKTAVWDGNYKGVWHLADNAANTTVKDSTSNANNGADSVNTSTRTATGEIDGALLFQNASSNTVSLGNSASLHVSSTFTFQGWVNLTSTPTPGAYGLLTCSNTIGYNYAFLINNNRSIQYRENNSSSGAGNNIGGVVPLNTWTFVTATFDGTNIRFYQNGALSATAASALGDSTTGGCFMGGSFASGNSYFDGTLDEIRFSASVRSPDWIAAEYNNESSPATFYTLGGEQSGPQVATPTFSPAAGTYTTTQMVTISTTTSGASMRYTTDGSTPTSSTGTLYSGAITVSSTIALKAIAYATGMSDSAVATAAYAIYSYHRSVVIAHAKVPNTDQTNFPVLFNTTDALLKTAANGGHVQNANGYDIIFTSDAAGTVKLDHEIEYYNAATGKFTAWVRLPSVSHTTDTVIYLFYGNSNITTSQENKTAVWDSNFKGVWHLADNAANTTVRDSTSNANNGADSVNTSTRTATGEIDGALLFQNASSNTVSLGNSASLHVSSTFTFQGWVNLTSTPTPGAYGLLTCSNTIGYNYAFLINNNRSIQYRENNSSSGAGNNIGSVVPLNTWTFVTATFDGTNIRFYQNGALSATAASALGDSTTGGCFMGGSSSSSNSYFDGTLDEIRLSASVRSPDWIAAEYNNESSPATFYTLSGEL